MKFVDLFAGLGGFHLALSSLGHKCVFASELDPGLQDLYEKNFGIRPKGDIRKISVTDIPSHDILCAGFPCQPFSKAGNQQGFNHPKWGDLFDHTLKIIIHHQPSFILLENVPNLIKHNHGRTWKRIQSSLKKAGYNIDFKRLSPHRYGIPQIRERIFIVGTRLDIGSFRWPKEKLDDQLSIESVLDTNPKNPRKLSKQMVECVNAWQSLIKKLPKNEAIPLPIWSMEFGSTYPYEMQTPFSATAKELSRYKGVYGASLKNKTKAKIFNELPSYARVKQSKFPKWKIKFIQQNRAFYKKNKKLIDDWLPKILKFPPSLQKFEWNCKGEKRDIWQYVIQVRASGVRVKRRTTSPSLVAMTTTQVPIIGWERRYMTPKECARLQSMDNKLTLPKVPTRAYQALGNAVNVELVRTIAKALFKSGKFKSSPIIKLSNKNKDIFPKLLKRLPRPTV